MKALSLKQPWAELVVQGKKIIELRGWRTNFRGEFYVHASKSVDYKSMRKFRFTELPTGAIIGKVCLEDIKEYKNKSDFKSDKGKHLVDYVTFKRYGFILKNPERITPMSYKGSLSFFEVKLE